MAFGQKVEAKDILGMDQDEFHSKLGKVADLDSRFSAFQEEQNKATSTILERLEALQPKPVPQPQVDPDVSFLANPSQEIQNYLRPLQQQSMDNAIMIMQGKARERYPKEFELWGTEINRVMQETDPIQQTNAKAWSMAVDIVRGRHAADLEKAAATGNYTFLEPVSAGLRPDPKTSDGLSPEQRKMVGKLRHLGPQEMTPEKYRRGEQRLAKSRNERLGSFAEVS